MSLLQRALIRGLSISLCSSFARGARALSVPPAAALKELSADSAKPSSTTRLMLLSSGLTTPKHERAFKDLLSQAAAGSKPRIHMVVTGQLASSNETPEGSSRSPGELRRRRWADARKKGRLISSRLGVPVECIDCARSQGEDLQEAMRDAHCIWVAAIC